MKNRNYEKMISLYFSCTEGFKEFESTPRHYGTEDLLYSSEIHTLQMIAKQKKSNLSQLAKYLGISKSGISKFIKKLLDKELIIKNNGTAHKKEVFFTLTPKGEIAYLAHEKFDRNMFASIFELMDSFSKEELRFLEHFLTELSHRLTALNKTEEAN